MKKSIWRAKFDPTAEYVVSKTLRFGGRTFEIGEPFDVKTSERQKRTLYDSRFLSINPNPTIAEIEEVPVVGSLIEQQVANEQPRNEQTNPAQDDPQKDGDNSGQPAEPNGDDPQSNDHKPEQSNAPVLRHMMVSRGWYNVVDPDGNIINEKKLRLKDAIELAAKR